LNEQQKHEDTEEITRQLRRQLDEAQFMTEKAKKEGEFSIGLARAEGDSAMRLVREEVARAEAERELLKGELGKMKAYYEAKLQ
jgi:hypothetical protein